MKKFNRIIGNKGEDMAVSFLKQKGYYIMERNYANRCGEIDIIAMDQEYLVFVEVKARKNRQYGSPAEAVDEFKQKHIIDTASIYLQNKGWNRINVRFDIVEIVFDENYINLYKNAFVCK